MIKMKYFSGMTIKEILHYLALGELEYTDEVGQRLIGYIDKLEDENKRSNSVINDLYKRLEKAVDESWIVY